MSGWHARVAIMCHLYYVGSEGEQIQSEPRHTALYYVITPDNDLRGSGLYVLEKDMHIHTFQYTVPDEANPELCVPIIQ